MTRGLLGVLGNRSVSVSGRFLRLLIIRSILGMYLGRPSQSNMEEVTVSTLLILARRHSRQQSQRWFPCISKESLEGISPVQNLIQKLHLQRVLLVELMDPFAAKIILLLEHPVLMLLRTRFSIRLGLSCQKTMSETSEKSLRHPKLLSS
ncbi:hypothetical protein K461DRAFT_66649 [Myriangium duriaei CBS 260.36]|uniref:Uncharacterized protein n=1 Tax=Myriangium duriaei CBS 260.36 TaxID=1168546 RepID=A0A9P4ISX0_9PEZI|nr:hypothetical protein K461DRAFT_66649 [Myriangium duriaei CBS 260.36]